MDPREFCQIADELAQGANPAHWRSATSRAYYAVFNVSAAHLRSFVPIAEDGKGHGQVSKALSGCNNEDVKQVGNDLAALHSRRIDADYRMNSPRAEDQKTVKVVIAEALQMIQDLDNAFQGSASQSLKKSIQQYWIQVLNEPLRGCKPIP